MRWMLSKQSRAVKSSTAIDTYLAQNIRETDTRSRKFKQKFAQVLDSLGQFSSTKEDFPRYLKDLLEASSRRAFTGESAELTKPVLGEPAQGLEEAVEILETSPATKETTVRHLKEETPRMVSSKNDTTTLETQNQQMSSQK